VKSAAHGEWQGARSRRLDRLLDAHKAAEGAGAPGRRWRTEQINWSLALLLAAEFQGYARDLHNEAGNSFAILAAQGNPTLETILKTRMTQNRQLDRGNANPGNLGTDFKILGLDLWGDLKTQWPGLAPKWSVNLAELNQARNAIAHSQSSTIESMSVNLRTIWKWRRSLDGLADKMDDVVASHLKDLFKIGDPWQLGGGTP
jgi:hypothetical protein